MSVREEDRENKNCPSRGLGLAAAAIGVGVGAALYYFFSKRPENPHEEGSTSTWECEQTQAFTEDELEDTRQENLSDDSYITLSEHSTTDTSIHTSPLGGYCSYNDNESSQCNSDDDDDNMLCSSDDNENSQCTDDDNESQSNDSMVSLHMDLESSSVTSDTEIYSISSDSEETASLDDHSDETGEWITDTSSDWDVTNSLFDIPIAGAENHFHLYNFIGRLQVFVNPRDHRNGTGRLTEEEQMERARALSEEEQLKFLRDQAFRERSWSLEECSICFEVILKNQEVMSLACTHHFHTACILPWLQEQQTCPNCRKAAE